MKIVKSTFLLFICLFLVTACTSSATKNGLESLKKNQYNFADFKQFYHKGIYFYIPEYFTQDYNKSYLLKTDGVSYVNYETGIHFSCERFNENEAKDYIFAFEEGISELDAIHSYYIKQRVKSLEIVKFSVKHSRKQNLKGFYQVLEGKQFDFGKKMIYTIGTLEKKIDGNKYYYVLQLVSSKELSAYLLDDFKKILSKTK